MKKERISLWSTEEYQYPAAYDFLPNITTYLHEDDTVRPAVIVVPGGGYRVVAPSEGEIVALEFYRRGYQAFVCTYTTNPFSYAPLKMQPLSDLARAVRVVRKNAAGFHLDPKKVAVCGFSAGGHLCGSLAVHFDSVEDTGAYADISARPDAAILSYPVITSGEFAHMDSFIALLGNPESPEERNWFSLETQVHSNVPPVFLWQTVTDETVSIENTYLFADACRKHGVPYAHHVFPRGSHGLSLSNEVVTDGDYGEPFTCEQLRCIQAFLNTQEGYENDKLVCEGTLNYLTSTDKKFRARVLPDVAIWPELADQWMKTL